MNYIFLATTTRMEENATPAISEIGKNHRKSIIYNLGCAVSVYSDYLVPDASAARRIRFIHADKLGREHIYALLQGFKFVDYAVEQKSAAEINDFAAHAITRTGNNMVVFGEPDYLNGICDTVQSLLGLKEGKQFYGNVLDVRLFDVKSKQFSSVLGLAEEDTTYENAYLALQQGKSVLKGYFEMLQRSRGMTPGTGSSPGKDFKEYKQLLGLK